MDMSAKTYQVATHFAALIEGILMAPLKTIERFFLHFNFLCRTVSLNSAGNCSWAKKLAIFKSDPLCQVKDSAGNLIQRWDRVFTTKGVFAGEVKLAQAPLLGDWNITVDVSGQIFSTSFLVSLFLSLLFWAIFYHEDQKFLTRPAKF